MKILFLTILNITDIKQNGLYEDLINEFVENGHDVTIVSPYEKRFNKETAFIKKDGYDLLKVKTGNIQKTSFIEKGISTLLLPYQYKNSIKKYLNIAEYDYIMCSTPPITLASVVDYLKRKTKAQVLLLLKDIWPQSMIDMEAIKPNGLIHRYFMGKEKNIYKIADWIGCTSQANIDFVKKANIIDDKKLLIITNGLSDKVLPSTGNKEVLSKYNVPTDKKVFFYGGNLGIPQDIEFLKKCIGKCADKQNVHFVVCGHGTQKHILQEYIENEAPGNLTLLEYLSQNDYTELVAATDVCMVFLNHKFKVPNCPARFYAYMQSGKPVLAVTDTATDIRFDIENGEFGWWCESVDENEFSKIVDIACEADLQQLSKNSRNWFESYYTTNISYKRIIEIMEKG